MITNIIAKTRAALANTKMDANKDGLIYKLEGYCGTQLSHAPATAVTCSSPSMIVNCQKDNAYTCECNDEQYIGGYHVNWSIDCN